MSSSKTTLGFLGGLAIGATIGILLAPDKGVETRKKIVQNGLVISDDFQLQLGQILNTISSFINATKTSGNEMITDSKLLIEQINESIVKEV